MKLAVSPTVIVLPAPKVTSPVSALLPASASVPAPPLRSTAPVSWPVPDSATLLLPAPSDTAPLIEPADTTSVSLPLPVRIAPVISGMMVVVLLAGACVIATPDVLAERSIAVACPAA